MDLNLLKIGFFLMALFMVVLGGLMNTIEKYLPAFLVQTFRYGKFAYQGESSFFKPIEVPKRWFQHFYIFAAVNSTLATLLMIKTYFYGGKQDTRLLFSLDLLASSQRKATVSATSALLAVILLTIQSWHRLYETWFISIFSDVKINIAHYIVGYIHYFGSVAAILAESPGFINPLESVPPVRLADVSLLTCVSCILFLWACFNQYKAAVVLASLRKNKKGEIVSTKHKIPRGHWFELVSSPHYLAEILMYFSLTIILWGSSVWPAVFMWVLSNQVESALLTHWWYKDTFKDYPTKRKAIIPYVL